MRRMIVVGGTFAGVSAACALAQSGVHTVLIDEHAFPGGDVAACRHTFVQNGGGGCRLDQPNGRTKMELYARLQDAGVELLLNARVSGVFADGAAARGVAIATKHGLFRVMADRVLDATEAQLCAFHLTGQRAVAREAEFCYDLSQADGLLLPVEAMPEALGLTGNAVHLGFAAAAGTVNASFRFPVTEAEQTDRTRLERRAHELMVRTAVLLRERPGLGEAVISLPASHTRLFYGALPQDGRVLRIGSALPPDFTAGERRRLESEAERTALGALEDLPGAGEDAEWFCAGRRIQKYTAHRDEAEALERLTLDPTGQGLPERRAQVLIAGTGTGGAMAAWACSMQGAEMLCFDSLYYAGGTNTVGRVYSAWHGYTGGMFARRAREVAAQPDAQAMTDRVGAMIFWERMLGGLFVGGATLCGAALEDRRLVWALVCDADGLSLVRGDYVIDGTADGDLCALAGLPYALGGGRDGLVQTASMWGYETRPVPEFPMTRYNSDEDMIDVDSYRDELRGLGLGYRHNSAYEIVEMCMQRESRRFDCLSPLSMRSIARRACPEDTVAVALCRHDTHGIPSSLLNRFYMYSPAMNEPDSDDIRVRIPYGMFLPKGADNLAIVGKSMAGEREAVNLCRMNPDLSNAAFAAGWVTARAAKEKVLPLARADARDAQPALKELGVLPDWALAPGDALGPQEAVRRLADPQDHGFAAMVQEPDEIVPLLLERLDEPGLVGDSAAMALAWHRRPEAAPRLNRLLREALEKDIVRFEVRRGVDVMGVRADGFSRLVNPNPRYGSVNVGMDDPDFTYGRINRLILLTGLCGAADAELLLPLAERTQPGFVLRGKTPYARSRVDTHRFVQEARIWALAHAFERLCDRRFAGALERLLEEPQIAGLFSFGPAWSDVSAPRLAFTGLLLARSAAHCGSRLGADCLVSLLDSPRSVFAKAARRALQEVYGDRARTACDWKHFLDSQASLPAVPYAGDPYLG